MTDDFLIPRGWIARERAVRHMWSLTDKFDLDPELATAAQRAADEDDDDAFMAAVAKFFEALAEAEGGEKIANCGGSGVTVRPPGSFAMTSSFRSHPFSRVEACGGKMHPNRRRSEEDEYDRTRGLDSG